MKFAFILFILLSFHKLLRPITAEDHLAARKILVQAFEIEMEREPTTVEIQLLTAMSGHETGFYGNMLSKRASNNWGSVKLNDSIMLKSFTTALDGACAFICSTLKSKRPRRAKLLENAVLRRSTLAWATALYTTHYFTGDPLLSPEQRINSYSANMMRNARSFTKILNEKLEISP